MYFKMALKNVKKSFKDYSIYFLTLSIAVCIFYSFNSLESQKALLDMKNSKTDYISALMTIISYISVLVSIVLGCLILYANNFLIKRRNRELGLYMTLGMGKRKISMILVFETFLVGIISLIIGLFIGVIVSQCVSILVLNLFNVNMEDYRFAISGVGIVKTILYFALMFFIVMIFNIVLISKYKIIDLLNLERKNEKIKFNKPSLYVFLIIFSILCLILCYKFVLVKSLNVKDIKFLISIGLGIIGTVVLFYSLSGIMIYTIKNNKNIYFKKLNIFTMNQISSKVKTNFISMSVICLMLFITITALYTGISLKKSMEESIKELTPFDASLHIYGDKNIDEVLKDINLSNDLGEEFSYINRYSLGIKSSDYVDLDGEVTFLKVSEYNKSRELINKPLIDLLDDEVYIISSDKDSNMKIHKFVRDGGKIFINNKEYSINDGDIIKENLTTDIIPDSPFTIIVNDEICDEGVVLERNINIKYPLNRKEECEEKYSKINKLVQDNEGRSLITIYTRDNEYKQNIAITGIMLIILIYLGFIFLITSIAVLGLQQLTEASDSIKRYISLRKIGASEKMINKTIFNQTSIYFMLPAFLALIHSIIGIRASINFLSLYDSSNKVPSILITLIIFMVVYIGYFVVTFTSYKNIVKSKI